MDRRQSVIAAFVLLGTITGIGSASGQTPDLTRLSLEDLLSTEVTSVSRKEQTLLRTAAAVYVITREDIRRSGAKTIPDLIRMVPGFAVGQIDASSWAVSARGFNGLYSNKLLVLIDGRSVYSPMFGGVHWEMQNVPLGDIERIEVIRGPGGTLWGVNAVNGVINIITKPADATQGGLVNGGVGTHQRAATEFRYGGRAGGRAHYRVFGKYSNRESGRPLLGFDNPDASDVALGGVRLDWNTDVNTIALHGIVQEGRGDHVRSDSIPFAPWRRFQNQAVSFTDGNVNLSWTRSTSSRSELGVQAYYQKYARAAGGLEERWHVADLEARQRRAVGRRHEIVAGLGYRFSSSAVVNTPGLSFLPAEETTHLFSGFVQDDITIGSSVSVMPGVKVEHNPYTGFELQPSVRATWLPAAGHSFWAAVTRAVRTPSKLDRGFRVLTGAAPGPGGIPLMVSIEGNPAYQSEDVEAFETGYRWQHRETSVDVTTFWNGYDRLRGTQIGVMTLGSYEGRTVRFIPVQFANVVTAVAHGAEGSITWQPLPWWKLSGSYAWMRIDARNESDPGAAVTDPSMPEQQVHLRSYWDLPWNAEASALFYGVSAINGTGVEPYRKFDAKLAWRASRRLELAVIGQNLLHHGEVEFIEASAPQSAPVRRAIFGEVALRF